MSGNSTEEMRLTLHVWRQANAEDKGGFETYQVLASPDMSFLEMIDVLNEHLIEDGRDPVAAEDLLWLVFMQPEFQMIR